MSEEKRLCIICGDSVTEEESLEVFCCFKCFYTKSAIKDTIKSEVKEAYEKEQDWKTVWKQLSKIERDKSE